MEACYAHNGKKGRRNKALGTTDTRNLNVAWIPFLSLPLMSLPL